MTGKDLLKRDVKRDVGAELLESVKQMKLNEVRVAYSSAIAARQNVGGGVSLLARESNSVS
jgi:hypothetical protein